MKNYKAPTIKNDTNILEGSPLMDSSQGCQICCPMGFTSYNPLECPYTTGCTKTHVVENGKVISSTCPKFIAGDNK